MNDTDWIQPIVVRRSGSHEEMIAAVASASVLAYAESADDPSWVQWLSGPFTKSVRRGTNGQVTLASTLPEAQSTVDVGDAEAHGFLPVQYKDMPPLLRKMQVSGTEQVRTGRWVHAAVPDAVAVATPTLVLNPSVAMTTGKTAAQAAHGSFLWWLGLGPTDRKLWADNDCALSVCQALTPATFARAVDAAAAVVTDAGFTEIPAGSLTVAVLPTGTAESIGLLPLSFA